MAHATDRPDNSLTEEAAYWYARLRNEKLSEVEGARFRAWLSGHPNRRREFDELCALWDDLDAVAESPELLAERRRLAPNPPVTAKRWMTVSVTALAASIVCAVGVMTWQRVSTPSHYVTSVGEQRTIPLTDGSVVTLNTSSEIRLRYSGRERRVELLSGQAIFDVAKDAARPFIVSAGDGEVKALGTVFDVYKRSDEVIVTLIEGRVAVLPERPGEDRRYEPALSPASTDALLASTRANSIVLHAGERVAYGSRNAALVRSNVDLHRAAAWRTRKLDFSETPLTEAIAEANRYSQVKIELHAPGLEQEKISGVFDAGRNDSVAEGLRSYFGLQLERTNDNRIVLASGDVSQD